ncbi:MAG: SCO family protein [Alphaproteobacteria bacterium]|jgi:protein SCO1/2|nr:SCO family protein [Alphaproteobacteria bacterium]
MAPAGPRLALLAIAAAVFWLGAPGALSAQGVAVAGDPDRALEVSQAAIGRRLDGYRFLDTERRSVQIDDFRGKPLVVNLIYTACVHTCPLITQTLLDVADGAREALGEDSFNIVTIGFDAPNDTPQMMRAFARTQGLDLDNWQFLSADSRTVERLTETLGFVYFPSAKGFDHLAQLSVIDAEGLVYRQVYGETFEAPFLVEPLKDLVFGRQGNYTSVEGLINRLKLFCTLYDPAAGRYRFDYSVFIGAGIGILILLVLGTILVRAILRERRGREAVSSTG